MNKFTIVCDEKGDLFYYSEQAVRNTPDNLITIVKDASIETVEQFKATPHQKYKEFLEKQHLEKIKRIETELAKSDQYLNEPDRIASLRFPKEVSASNLCGYNIKPFVFQKGHGIWLSYLIFRLDEKVYGLKINAPNNYPFGIIEWEVIGKSLEDGKPISLKQFLLNNCKKEHGPFIDILNTSNPGLKLHEIFAMLKSFHPDISFI